jgi:diacylglycerol kinase (ATP)
MAGKKIAFIINPKAGRKRSGDIAATIRRYLDTEKYDPVFRYTEFGGHASKIVDELLDEGLDIIIAVGGDGTVNEVARRMINKKATFGIVPKGSGNGLARHLGIPVRLPQAVSVLNRRESMLIDAGRLDKYWFFCTCGLGFDARIGHKFAMSEIRGFRSYMRTIAKEFRKYKPRKYNFKVDDKSYRRRAFLITIANAGQYGNNAYIAPGARIDDGLFNICILKPFPLIKTLFLGLRLFNRSIERTPYMEVIQGKEIVFKKSKKKFVFHYDGEPVKFKKNKVKIVMHHQCLKVIANRKERKL